MALERLAPDAILEQSGCTGTLAAIQDDPDAPDGNWHLADSTSASPIVRVSFPTPTTGQPRPAQGAQEFRVRVKKQGGSGTPKARIELWEGGALVRAGTDTNVTSTNGVVLALTWDASEIATTSGAAVECRVVCAASGGSPSARATVDVGAIEWNADTEIAALSLIAPTLDVAVGLPAPVVTPGPVALTAPVLDVAVELPAPSVSQGGAVQSLAAPVLDVAAALPTPTVTPGPVALTAPLLAVAVELPPPSIQSGAVVLGAPLLEVAAELPPPTVQAEGPLALAAPLLELGVVLPTPTVAIEGSEPQFQCTAFRASATASRRLQAVSATSQRLAATAIARQRIRARTAPGRV